MDIAVATGAAVRQFRFIVEDGDGRYVEASLALQSVDGISGEPADDAGKHIPMVVPDGDVARVEAGASISAGDLVATDAEGRAILWVDGAGAEAWGRAREDAVEGQIFEVLFALKTVGAGDDSGVGPSAYPDRIGINAGVNARYIASSRFRNVMKMCENWTGPNATNVDSNGNPAVVGDYTTRLWLGSGGYHKAGTYTVTYAGTGTISVTGDATATITASGQTFDIVTPSGGVQLVFHNGDVEPSNMHDIDIRHSDDLGETTHVTDEYVDFLAPIATCLRAMDLIHTNDSPEELEADRPTVDRYSWNSVQAAQPGSSVRGTPLPVLCEMANRVGAANGKGCDLWFCFPHKVEDAYVTAVAAYCEANLDGDLYVEYSNEIWNGLFGQGDYCDTQAGLRGLTGATKRFKFQKERSIEIFDLCLAAYGGDASRIVRVIAGQMGASATVINTVMSHNSGDNGKVDLIAVAPYFGASVGSASGNPSGRKPTSAADVLFDLDLALAAQIPNYDATAAAIAVWGKPLGAYEGGWASIISGGDGDGPWNADTDLQGYFNEACRTAGLELIYDTWLRSLKTAGISYVVNHYMDITFESTASTADRWGLTFGISDTPRPKWDALAAAQAAI